MRLYVGITDRGWYDQLSAAKPDEVNFWKPGSHGGFASLNPGEPFLFKLHAPENFIVGGGFFVRFSKLPASLAWLAFGQKNGVLSFEELLARVRKLRRESTEPDPVIGNIILTQPFWLKQDDWVPIPSNWPMSTVQGKTYDALDSVGHSLWMEVQSRIAAPTHLAESPARYDYAMTKLRLGQGGFRVSVTEAYARRCAITGESTLPVLEAAHIKPYSLDGPHEVSNGLLLRSDMHILFDKGLMTVTPDLRIEVSGEIEEQYSNGKLYYSYRGEELRSVPGQLLERPSPEFLAWHNENVFRP